MVIPDL